MGFGTGQAGNFQSELFCQLSGSSSGTGENFKVLSDATGLLQHFMLLRLKLNKSFLSCHSAVGPQTMVIPFFLLFSHFQKLVYHTATETQVLAAHSVPSSLFYSGSLPQRSKLFPPWRSILALSFLRDTSELQGPPHVVYKRPCLLRV